MYHEPKRFSLKHHDLTLISSQETECVFVLVNENDIVVVFQNSMGDCDMALALNRYLCNAVLPLLTNNSYFFQDADYASHLLDQTLHTAYQLSKCRSLTKNQRDVVSDFLVALTRYDKPLYVRSYG